MPDYLVRVSTDAILDRKGLDRLEDVVYDVLTGEQGGSLGTRVELVDGRFENAGGVTDVEAIYN